MPLYSVTSPHYIPRLPFTVVEGQLEVRPAVIVPVAGLEPLGREAALGCSALCCNTIADRVSQSTGVLLAPLLAYGHATPYRSFGGAVGLKEKHLATGVADIVRGLVFQGARVVFLFDGSVDNAAALGASIGRATGGHPGCVVKVIAWQRNGAIRSFAASRLGGGGQAWRCEHGILSMALHLDPSMVGNSSQHSSPVSGKGYDRWRRRGRDPEQLRKLMPSGVETTSLPDAEFGGQLLDRIVEAHTDEVSLILGASTAERK